MVKICFSHVENPDFTPVMVFFEQAAVNGLEGNDTVVCASAIFPELLLRSTEGLVQLTVDVSILDQGFAGILCTDNVSL